jgi:hypothetical protein
MRWEDSIMMNFMETKWLELAQDHAQWWALVLVVMNLLVFVP